MPNLQFFFGTTTIELIQGVGVVTRAIISRFSKSSSIWNSVRRMLNWPSRLIQHHVIFACKSTYTIRKDTRKPLKQLVSGDRGSSPGILCINSTFGRLWSVQLVVVLIRNNVHSKARFNHQNRPDSLAFNQIAVKQTSKISTPYTRRNFPEDRN